MSIRALLLVCCIGLLPAMEVVVELPNPSTVDVAMQGSLKLVNPDVSIDNMEIGTSEDVDLHINPASRSTRTSIVNGQRTSVVELGLTARFKRTGAITVPPVTLVDDQGGRHSSAPVVIRVQSKREDLVGAIVCTVRLDPDHIVPGQTCQLIYEVARSSDRGRLYDLRNLDGAALPSGAIELGETEHANGTATGARGRRWIIDTFRSDFTMTTPGTYRIGGQQDVLIGRRQRDAVPVKPVVLTVAPLPSDGRPDDFTNIVGEITLAAELDRKRIAVGEGALLTLTISGDRLGFLERPPLPPIDGLQVYPRERDTDDEATAGSLTFSWDLVPERPGSYDIPPVDLPWFDPATRSYQRARSEPLLLTVIPGRKQQLQVVGSLPATTPDAPSAELAVQLPEPIGAIGSSRLGTGFMPLAALVGLVTALGAGLVLRLQARGPQGPGPAQRCRHALAAGNLAGANQALAELVARQGDTHQRAKARELLQAVENARFGQSDGGASLAAQAAELREP